MLLHGTSDNAPRDSFDPSKTTRSVAHATFWTSHPGLAEVFARRGGGIGIVYAGIARIEKPFDHQSAYSYKQLRDIDPDAARAAARFLGLIDQKGTIVGATFDAYLKATIAHREGITLDATARQEAVERVTRLSTEALRSAGFDGLKYKYDVGKFGDADVWAAFDADQVRHVDDPRLRDRRIQREAYSVFSFRPAAMVLTRRRRRVGDGWG